MSRPKLGEATHLGDGVYVRITPQGQILLTTENGGPPSNIIYMEPEVYVALTQFVEKLG